MRLGSVGRVEGANRSDLDSHADCRVCVKEILVFNDFYHEVTVTGWDLEGETQSLRIVSTALGYTMPQSEKTVLLIVHQSILSSTLNHNLISTMQMRLHDAIVYETPKFQSLNPKNLSHSISVRGDNVDGVLVIPLELYGVVSCLPTLKPTHLEFETCDRYELMYESPEYDPSAKTCHGQEAGMMDSWGNLKVSGDSHPKRRQVFFLRQNEAEVKPVLDDGTLLAELDNITTNLNVFNLQLKIMSVKTLTSPLKRNVLLQWTRMI
jgi:hypothetical protein